MQMEMKVSDFIGERISTAKGGVIQNLLIVTSKGSKEVVKVHASGNALASLTALKVGDVFTGKQPDDHNFFFLQG
mgnify:CR=1 FL=1